MQRISKEVLHCRGTIKKWNFFLKKMRREDLKIDIRRAQHGYDCLNSIIFTMANAMEFEPIHIKNYFDKNVYAVVMEWQNGWLSFQKK